MSAIRLLYVDDEPDIREVATFSLEIDPQIEVRAAASGAEALALLDGGGWRPDVVLLDVMMPDMDGPSTLSNIRRRDEFQATPVIFITARAQPHERAAFLEKGAIGVITKPFDPMTLAQDVRNLLAAR
jgi:two-component system, OmpR family, response regulator